MLNFSPKQHKTAESRINGTIESNELDLQLLKAILNLFKKSNNGIIINGAEFR